MSLIRNIVNFFLLFSICNSSIFATSIREITLDEMLEQSQLVFEGKVINLHTTESIDGLIQTHVTFIIKDIIKGKHSSGKVTLSFLGGTVGVITSAVGGMKYPEMGEHGIYFVESTGDVQAHPLYGWSQGHFIIGKDATGSDRVMTNRRIPVTKLMSGSAMATVGLSTGVARGIVSSKKFKQEDALTAQEFKGLLIERLRNRP